MTDMTMKNKLFFSGYIVCRFKPDWIMRVFLMLSRCIMAEVAQGKLQTMNIILFIKRFKIGCITT